MRSLVVRAFIALSFAAAVGCATGATLRAPSGEPIRVTSVRGGALELVTPGDAAYAAADPAGATGAPGEGKVVKPYVVRLTRDLTVYRLWSGNNRMGQWWTFDAPAGTLSSYRARYEVCESWSSLRSVATCTLRRGAVVVIGAGQSVSAQTCGRPNERYPANPRDMQVYIREAWKQGKLSCPPAGADYLNDPLDIGAPLH